MRGLEHQVVDGDVGVELFDDFTPQRGGVRFAVGDLAAGKLPVPGQVDAVLPSCDEKPVIVLDDGGDDVFTPDALSLTPAGCASSAMRTRSASCDGVNGFCSSGTPPQNVPWTSVASSRVARHVEDAQASGSAASGAPRGWVRSGRASRRR